MKRSTIEKHIKAHGVSVHQPVTFNDLLALADEQAEAERVRTPEEQAAERERAERAARAAALRAEAAQLEAAG